jgi:PAS domain S-box-containing protein
MKISILIIDDDLGIIESLSIILEEEYDVACAHSGMQALETLEHGDFPIVILDLLLPDMDGLEVLREIRRRRPSCSIIINTGYATIERAVGSLNEGADAFLTKPFSPHDLKSAIQKLARNFELVEEKKRLERALRKSEEKYRMLVEGIQEGIFILDGLTFEYASPPLLNMLGFTPSEIINQDFPKILFPDDVPKIVDTMQKRIRDDGRFVGTECRFLHRDGHTIIDAILSEGRIDLDGKEFIIGTIRDISERKKIERRLIQHEKLRALGEMAGGIAHDFNNLLGAILGHVQLLQMRTDNPETGEELKLLEELTLEGSDMIRRIQEFSRVEPSKVKVRLDLNSLVRECLDVTRPKWKDERENAGVHIRVRSDLAEIPAIDGNPSALREMLVNLILNAIDAMPEGGELTVVTRHEGDSVCLSVIDTGIGIPEDLQRNIFDPFFTTKGFKGSGLGLSMTYGIVSRHKGEISVDSKENAGTEISIRFPAHREEKASRGHEMPERFSAGDARILVIDDEENIRQTLAEMLRMKGFNVSVASSGEEGLAVFEQEDFEVVFTDLGMPGMSGWQVTETMKRAREDVKVILMTGWGAQIEPMRIRESRLDEVLPKPFKFESVMAVLGSVLCQGGKR